MPAKLLQSFPTLCNPKECSPPGFSVHEISQARILENESESQSCLTLCNPMDYTVHGILQARTLEWVAFPFSRGSSQHRDRTQVSHIAGRFFTSWATRDWSGLVFPFQGIFPTQGLNPHLLWLLHWQVGSLTLSQLRSPWGRIGGVKSNPGIWAEDWEDSASPWYRSGFYEENSRELEGEWTRTVWIVWNVTEDFLIMQEIQTNIRFRDITLTRILKMGWRRRGGR